MKEKLMIVGKDLIISKDLMDSLKDSFEISVVSDGVSAINELKQLREDMVVLLSLVLPRIDGYQVLRAMKSIQFSNKVKVVAMTGAETYQIHLNEFSELVDKTIRKPETIDEIKNLKETILLAC